MKKFKTKNLNYQVPGVTTEEILRPMERGQITLPAKMRRSLHIDATTWLKVTQIGEEIRIKPVKINAEDNPDIIPAEMPFNEMLKELAKLPAPDWKDDHFDYIKKIRKKLTKKEIKERYEW